MAFLRIEQKKSGRYLRIVETFRDKGSVKHRTLYSLGKVEDYTPEQLERIAKKLLAVCSANIQDIINGDFQEVARLNYGYALIINNLWKRLNLNSFVNSVQLKSKVHFDWPSVLKLMIAERLNEPCSKHACFGHQQEYIGFGNTSFNLQYFYRTLDILYEHQDKLKDIMFQSQQNIFSNALDVVFYDVTTLYFDSQKEDENSLRKKGYSKDGKAHKTQIVLGLLVDKMRNPITYHIYQGNTYEGKTMLDALADLKSRYTIDKVIVVADSAMIDSENRSYIEQSETLAYILGDRIKSLPKKIAEQLIAKENHKTLPGSKGTFTYSELIYKGRRIICTYSEKRALKDKYEREKLIEKAQQLIDKPAQLKQSKKRGAGRYIKVDNETSYSLDIEKIKSDEKWDGYKAIATTTNLSPQEIIEKYADLFEVEHAFRTLKSQLKVRPIFHWTNKRIEGHIAMCFMAYTMLNHLRISTALSEKEIIRAIDKMQVSRIEDKKTKSHFYIRSKICDNQKKIIKTLNLVVPKDISSEDAMNQLFR